MDAVQPPPAKFPFVEVRGFGCEWNQFTQGQDWDFSTSGSSGVPDCAAACEEADRCTGFEFGVPTNGPYCALWFNSVCSAESSMTAVSSYDVTTFVSNAEFKPAEKTTTAALIVERAPTTTVSASATTVEAAAVAENVYALKYPQQACEWSDFVENTDWVMHNDGSSDPEACAEACVATDGCTGFEVGSDSGSSFLNGPYCAFWLNGACSEPTTSFYGAISFTSGEPVEVDTYSLTTPIDAFVEFKNQACAWSRFVEGEEWEFASKDSDDAAACASLCLESGNGCTGFEVGSSKSTAFGDLTKGYCAFWYNSTCTPSQMISNTQDSSTYLMVGSEGCGEYYSSNFFYVAIVLFSVLTFLGVCCCCRRAMIRRRMALQRVRAARAAAAGSAATTARAVVYAVQIADDQEEPQKV